MSPDALTPGLLERRFRANDDFELIPTDRLAPAERRALGEAIATLYGVLRPRRPNLKTKAVSPEVAQLVVALGALGIIPEAARASMGKNAALTVARLVLDEILVLDTDAGLVTGTRARRFLFLPAHAPSSANGPDRIAELSLSALEYASRLRLSPDEALWLRLYFYNRIPWSEHWARQFPNPDQVAAILDRSHRETARQLNTCFRPVAPDADNDRWRIFEHLMPKGTGPARFKLYVSPHPSHVKEAFAAAVAAAAEQGAPSFKIGSDVYGLLRSDKLIIYTCDRAAVDALAARLGPELEGVPAQGVPFTAPLRSDGLLSWGIDPLPSTRIPGWAGGLSWRVWVAKALASALERQQRDAPEHPEPWAFALDRIRLDGVDPSTWTPAEPEPA